MKRLLLALALALASSGTFAQGNPTCPTRPVGDSTNACASTAFVQTAGGGGAVQRTRLSGNADYYVRRDGSDSNTGTANTAAGAWLTIGHALSAITSGVDLAGFNVVVHVNGSNVGDGTYTENLIVGGFVGYNGNGFGQFIVQGENGTTTINGATATATILAAIGGNASPIQFKSFLLANPNTSGIVLEADDGGFIALNTIFFGSTGSGGILAECTQEAGRLLFMAGTHTMASSLSTGTGFYGRSGCGVIFQPGVTINFSGPSTFSNAVADFATNAYFDNTGSTWSGTTPTGHTYTLDKNTGGLIVNQAIITGTLPATITPLVVGNGGTGDTGTAWTTFTPSPSCGTATITVATSKSKTLGKTTWAEGDFTITAIGTCAATNLTFNLPNTAQSGGSLGGRDTNSNKGINCAISASGTTGSCLKSDVSTWNINDHLVFSGVYENQ